MNNLEKDILKGNKEAVDTYEKIVSFMITKRESFICLDITDDSNSDLWKYMEANIVQTGFYFTNELKEELSHLSNQTLNLSYNLLLKILRTEKGANVNHKNFIFPDFPNQTRVTNLNSLSNLRFVGYLADLMELMTNEEYHKYIGLGEYAKHKDRTPLEIDMETLIPIRLGSFDDFYKTIQNLLGSRMALNESDKNMIYYFINNPYLDKFSMIPKEIPFKETWAYLLKLNYENNLELPIEFKNFFDFERALASFLDEDVSLCKHMNLKNLKNKERVFLLEKLNEGCKKYPDFMLNSMIKDREFVIIVNNRLHPSSYGKRFSYVNDFFKKVKEDKSLYTNEAKIEMFIANGDGLSAMKLALSNPGLAIRRLAKILSIETIEHQNQIIDMMKDKVSLVDLSVLLNTLEYFKTQKTNSLRVAFPKGNAKNSLLFVDSKEINKSTCEKVIEVLQDGINKKLSNKESLSNVFVDPILKDYNIPFSTRNESKSFRSVARGSRIKRTKNTNVIRAFVYKKISRGGFVDLSAAFLDENFNFLEQCSWTNLKTSNNSKPLAMHSGDGYNCQNGLSEFIDIDLEVLRTKKKYKYVIFEVLSYNHIPFNEMDSCFFGVMSRGGMFNDKIGKGEDSSHPKFYHMLTKEEQKKLDFKGEIFEPSTVQFRFDLTGQNCVCMPLLYDIEKDEFIWLDLDVEANTLIPSLASNKNTNKNTLKEGNVIPTSSSLCIENLQNGAIAACYAAVYMSKPNLYDLFVANVKARNGNLVEKKEDADIVCSLDGDVTPFYRDIITKDWM